MNSDPFEVVTDTATLCIFDLERLKPRLQDDADWWTTEDAELSEVNAGNVVFLGLVSDGTYMIHLVDEVEMVQISAHLKVTSGRVFIGAGEEVSADGLDPECLRGGKFISLSEGLYVVSAMKDGGDIFVSVGLGGSGINDFNSPLRFA